MEPLLILAIISALLIAPFLLLAIFSKTFKDEKKKPYKDDVNYQDDFETAWEDVIEGRVK